MSSQTQSVSIITPSSLTPCKGSNAVYSEKQMKHTLRGNCAALNTETDCTVTYVL
jgi:hypothetical protein